ncbi:MAG: hypothetical protein SGBAC_008717 [Bacillariaceae sp.]
MHVIYSVLQLPSTCGVSSYRPEIVMNACIASDEPTSYNPPQAPGSSSSDLTDPPKCALHNQRQTIRDETPFYDEINAAYRKADLQDSSVLDSKTTYSPFESPTVGHYTSLVSKNSNSSLNVSFREYSKFLQKEQDQEDDINILSSNPEDNFGDKFRRTVLRIVEKRKSRIKEEIDQKNREEKKRVGSPTDQACQKPQDDDSQNSQTLIIAKPKKENKKKIEKVVQEIVKDFSSDGDQKILRSIGRTATVNAAILATTLTGGAAGAGVAGLLTGGAMTAKRLGDGVEQEDETEVAKSIAVYGSATTASVVGQAVTGALLVGLAGVTLPVAGAVAFGVGCASGITAGALSEWGVDHALK